MSAAYETATLPIELHRHCSARCQLTFAISRTAPNYYSRDARCSRASRACVTSTVVRERIELSRPVCRTGALPLGHPTRKKLRRGDTATRRVAREPRVRVELTPSVWKTEVIAARPTRLMLRVQALACRFRVRASLCRRQQPKGRTLNSKLSTHLELRAGFEPAPPVYKTGVITS